MPTFQSDALVFFGATGEVVVEFKRPPREAFGEMVPG
jgi:hypothetical protein